MRFFISDVFADSRYRGNQLATFLDCADLSGKEMQAIAREVNFSETTFVVSNEERDGCYDVRIFTPKSELPFAGHPTLGTAFVIRNEVIKRKAKRIVLRLGVGEVPVTFADDGLAWMRQPPPEFGRTYDAKPIADMLSLKADEIDANCPILEVSTGVPFLIVPLGEKDSMGKIKVDAECMSDLLSNAWAQAPLVFAKGGQEKGQDLSVRVFPALHGIAEDAATGSGNGCLAAYLSRTRYLGSEKVDATVGQGYEMGRPSTLHLRASPTKLGIKVEVGGKVQSVAEGTWPV
ncbi:MAG: PhzF family phenazine biosynthesis protein [Methanomassiliicoccales archaeon]|nr:PhzF family phenazine biosynthesis protein [Methanomassiliicoccales archaeon]